MTRELLVSTSPHIRDEITTTRIMWAVAIALAPATGMGIWFFGFRVLAQVIVSVAAAILAAMEAERFSAGDETRLWLTLEALTVFGGFIYLWDQLEKEREKMFRR